MARTKLLFTIIFVLTGLMMLQFIQEGGRTAFAAEVQINKSSTATDAGKSTAASGAGQQSAQGDWKEALASELKSAGVAVTKITDDPLPTANNREHHPIWLYGKINLQTDREKIEKTVKAFVAKHPDIGPHDSVAFLDEDRGSGLVKICDLKPEKKK